LPDPSKRLAERLFSRILIANRGEIAVRIARTCADLGVECVAVHSDADATARHVGVADRAVRLPGVAPDETYLNATLIIDAARSTGAEAIHPGYGFLSENAGFATQVVDAGLVWIGPPPDAIMTLGDKISARRIAIEAGVSIVPGLLDAVTDPEAVLSFADEHGYPVAVKASGGGGGRGLKVAGSPEDVEDAWRSARREAAAYFGSSDVYVERYLEAPKHLEVQLLAPNRDEAMWLGVRDCSMQRRHQKLIEETPPPRWAERAEEMGAAAVALSKAAGYVNAGTVEMLVEAGDFYFLEVNSRLQVEHTVTEQVYGIDLVASQLRIAAGDDVGFTQTDIEPRGHAIECRINAEDPARGFAPAPGRLERYFEPGGFGVRVDSGYTTGDDIPSAYDSLIAKVIAWGRTREEASARMRRALEEFVVEGVATTIPILKSLLNSEEWRTGEHTTRTIDSSGWFDSVGDDEGPGEEVGAIRLWHPSIAASASTPVHAGHSRGEVVAPMQGTILDVLVRVGESVAEGDALIVLEAMKMETRVVAPRAGVVVELTAAPGEATSAGQILARVE
jgi:acetyl-CoA/propionyl-CoA carboxylase, biotin carboxylase, biotin carboxyl carrier protein